MNSFLIHIRFITWPAYLGNDFDGKNHYLVYADDYMDAKKKLAKDLRSKVQDKDQADFRFELTCVTLGTLKVV